MDTQVQENIKEGAEHRRYPRLHQTFPVKFQHLDERGELQGEVFRGFIRNVGKAGMAIESRIEKERDYLELSPKKTKLKLTVNIPADFVPIDSIATVRWSAKVSETEFDTYFFGVEYDQIDNVQQRMIEIYINRLRRKPVVFVCILLIAVALTVAFAYRILIAP